MGHFSTEGRHHNGSKSIQNQRFEKQTSTFTQNEDKQKGLPRTESGLNKGTVFFYVHLHFIT